MSQPPGWNQDPRQGGGPYGFGPQHGQQPPPYGPPPYDQPTEQYGQPQYGPPPYDQPTEQYGQPQYGPPPYDQPTQQYGQPQYGPPPPPYGGPPQWSLDQTQQLPPYGPGGPGGPGGPDGPGGPYGPPGYLGPPTPPPGGGYRTPLLIGLVVLVVGALVVGIVFFATRRHDSPVPVANDATTSAPTPSESLTPSETPTGSETPSASPSATTSASPSATRSGSPSATVAASASPGGDSQAPTEDQARSAAEAFLGDLKGKSYSLAWAQLCVAGQELYKTGSALQTKLGLDTKTLTDYRIVGVEDAEFNHDPRKDVKVTVTYNTGSDKNLTLSITLEHDQAAICGF
ncbi:MAG TPA: hypothetical protein VLJ59_08605 [Mycobacteriales bacterium]|nr:hypothetical protein [Mycobacteriales bacterium]